MRYRGQAAFPGKEKRGNVRTLMTRKDKLIEIKLGNTFKVYKEFITR